METYIQGVVDRIQDDLEDSGWEVEVEDKDWAILVYAHGTRDYALKLHRNTGAIEIMEDTDHGFMELEE